MIRALLAAMLLFAGTAGAQTPAAPAAPDPLLGSGGGLDHVLIWTRDRDGVTAALAVKLGFQVRPGGDFGDGIANRLIRFSDWTYLELLSFTRPGAELAGDAALEWRFTERGTGSDNFGLEVSDIDATAAHLRTGDLALFPETPMTYDPDGPGPLPAQPSEWRTIGFQHPPLASSDFFFIHYAPERMSPARQADRDVFTRHPNGARRISAIWLLTRELDADAARLRRIGFTEAGPVALPHYGARGLRFVAGRGTILLITPAGAGPAAEALAARGPQVFGISVETEDLERAWRIVQRGYGVELQTYAGPFGQSFAAPTRSDLGLTIEFHTGRQNQR
jgi:hypothetical protein